MYYPQETFFQNSIMNPMGNFWPQAMQNNSYPNMNMFKPSIIPPYFLLNPQLNQVRHNPIMAPVFNMPTNNIIRMNPQPPIVPGPTFSDVYFNKTLDISSLELTNQIKIKEENIEKQKEPEAELQTQGETVDKESQVQKVRSSHQIYKSRCTLKFSQDDDLQIKKYVQKYGRRWTFIAFKLNHRTNAQKISRRYFKLLQKEKDPSLSEQKTQSIAYGPNSVKQEQSAQQSINSTD